MTIESRSTLTGFKSIRRMTGRTITYTRGETSGTAVAVPADTIIEETSEDGFTIKTKVRDYLILRSDLEAILGDGETPQRDDTIDETVAGYVRTFDVLEVGREVWRWWDKSMQVIRVHTVEVSKETTSGETTTTDGA